MKALTAKMTSPVLFIRKNRLLCDFVSSHETLWRLLQIMQDAVSSSCADEILDNSNSYTTQNIVNINMHYNNLVVDQKC